mmetsp:Transcript_5807/g.6005  ORF Transcript_5807/g.6005 Transcript_5807/m.6005 type:complete len:275 (-) Transcript_5807:180-1004(-)
MSSKHLPSPISPVKWKEYSLSQAWGVSHIPPSRDSSLPKPGHISTQKKEAILEIKLREDNRAARFKLRSTIIQELTNRLGPKYKKEIPIHVDTLLSRKRNITPDDVMELEIYIRGNYQPSCPTTTRLSSDQLENRDSKLNNNSNNVNNNNNNNINNGGIYSQRGPAPSSGNMNSFDFVGSAMQSELGRGSSSGTAMRSSPMTQPQSSPMNSTMRSSPMGMGMGMGMGGNGMSAMGGGMQSPMNANNGFNISSMGGNSMQPRGPPQNNYQFPSNW